MCWTSVSPLYHLLIMYANICPPQQGIGAVSAVAVGSLGSRPIEQEEGNFMVEFCILHRCTKNMYVDEAVVPVLSSRVSGLYQLSVGVWLNRCTNPSV